MDKVINGISLLVQSSELLAKAVQQYRPEVGLVGGGLLSEGFYYDFDLPVPLNMEDLGAIDANLKQLSVEEAGGKNIIIQLQSVSGVYEKGDSRNKVLQRVYGVAFASRQELDAYQAKQEEAQQRDHRKLGKQLELYMFSEEAPGMPFYLPKGMKIRQELERLSREMMLKHGYEEVLSPLIMNQSLWEQSGHWEHYRDHMYFSVMDHQQYAVKPMNCPGHMLIYKNKARSYKELPIRLAEFGQVHRYEYSGALNGLLRVRTFCQDDAHIFVTPDQIKEEVNLAIQIIRHVYGIFGFEYQAELSTRPKDSMGSEEQWERAEAALGQVLEEAGLPYVLNPGDGAFYGPKIDFHIKDALGRSHQCGTIQLDFQMPEKFHLQYVDAQNLKQVPIVIHRAVYGSLDRFLGILVEHYGGQFPLWLAPVQVTLMPVAAKHSDYACAVGQKLREAGIRVEVDHRDEKLGYRVREAQMQKVPYIIVVGDQEEANQALQVRCRGSKEQRQIAVVEFLSEVLGKVRDRGL